jgi:hypothetical protein
MVAIQIRDVSNKTRDALAGEAERRGQSLQFFLHDVLEREAASARNLAWVQRARSRPPMITRPIDTATIIQEGREERLAQILGAVNRSVTPT